MLRGRASRVRGRRCVLAEKEGGHVQARGLGGGRGGGRGDERPGVVRWHAGRDARVRAAGSCGSGWPQSGSGLTRARERGDGRATGERSNSREPTQTPVLSKEARAAQGRSCDAIGGAGGARSGRRRLSGERIAGAARRRDGDANGACCRMSWLAQSLGRALAKMRRLAEKEAGVFGRDAWAGMSRAGEEAGGATGCGGLRAWGGAGLAELARRERRN